MSGTSIQTDLIGRVVTDSNKTTLTASQLRDKWGPPNASGDSIGVIRGVVVFETLGIQYLIETPTDGNLVHMRRDEFKLLQR